MDSTAVAGSAAEPHNVWCVETEQEADVAEHRHVLAIETAAADGRRFRWTAVQVIAAIRDGALFVVGDGRDGRAAVIEPAVCPRCQRATLVTDPDAALDAVERCA